MPDGAAVDEGPSEAPPAVCVTRPHFERAFAKVFPSVSRADRRMYELLRRKLSRARSHLAGSEATAAVGAVGTGQ